MKDRNQSKLPRGIAQQGSRSQALGAADPRHRRAGQELGTSQWLRPPFYIDDNGVVQLRLSGPLALTDDGQALTIRVADPLVIEHGSPERIALKLPANKPSDAQQGVRNALTFLGW